MQITYLPYDYVAFYLTKQNTSAAETARVYMRLVNKPFVAVITLQSMGYARNKVSSTQ
jgi:hypothetical protein